MLYAIAGGTLTIAEVQSSFPTTRTLPQQQESSMPLFAGPPTPLSALRHPRQPQPVLQAALAGTNPATADATDASAARIAASRCSAPVGDSLGTDNLDVLDADEAEDRAKERLLKVVGLLRRSRRIKAAA